MGIATPRAAWPELPIAAVDLSAMVGCVVSWRLGFSVRALVQPGASRVIPIGGKPPMKRILATGLVLLVIFPLSYAFAASMTVDGGSLGAGEGTVSACDPSITTSYTTVFSLPSFKVDDVVVGSVAAACAGKAASVALVDGSGALLAQANVASITLSSSAFNVDFAPAAVPAASVAAIQVVITG
jgi:hypothetical protein